MIKETIVIDATGAALGRVGSLAAKQALLGKHVVVVNCDEAIVIGSKEYIVNYFKIKRARGGSSMRGPNFPKHPFRLVKRIARGMLPYKLGRGRAALRSIICYNTVPPEYESAKKITLVRPLKVNSIKLAELSRIL